MTREFVVFSINEVVCALDVSSVRELLHAATLSASPGNSEFEGLLNLRGAVVPVIDVRSRLRLPPSELSASDFLIVIEHGDRLAAVRTESSARLEQADDAAIHLSESAGAPGSLIAGTLQLSEQIVSLLNVTALLSEVLPVKPDGQTDDIAESTTTGPV